MNSPSLTSIDASAAAASPVYSAAVPDHLRQWIDDGLRDLGPDAPVLALCGDDGAVVPLLTEYATDLTVLGLGARPAAAQRSHPEIAWLQHRPTGPLPFAHDTFDAIWCHEFLDRVIDPLATLREMHRVLVPGGRLSVVVPDHGTMRNVLIALFRWDEHFAPNNPRIRHFTRATLETLVQAAGFTAIHTATGGRVRAAMPGGLVPRSLVLHACKPRALHLTPTKSRRTAKPGAIEELAFASRERVA